MRSRTSRCALPHRRPPHLRRRPTSSAFRILPTFATVVACGNPAVLGPADQTSNLDGGPRDAQPAAPDAGTFALHPASDEPLVLTPASPSGFVRFQVDRGGGYRGTVEVTVDNLPPGVSATVVRVPPALPGGVVALSLDDDGAPRVQGRFDDALVVAEPAGEAATGLRHTAPLSVFLRGGSGDPDLTYGPSGDGLATVDGVPDLDEGASGDAALLPDGDLLIPITAGGADPVPALVRVAPDGRGLDPRFGDDGRVGPPTDAAYLVSLSVAVEPAGDTVIWIQETSWFHRAVRLTLPSGAVAGNLGRERTDVSVGVSNARRVALTPGDGPVHAFVPTSPFVYIRDDRLVRIETWAEIGRYPRTTEFFDPEMVVPLADGGALVGGHDAKTDAVEIHRLGPDGHLDRRYGVNGIANLGHRPGTLLGLIAGTEPADGGSAPATVVVADAAALRDAIQRLTPDGLRDDEFGRSGRIERPPGLAGPVGGLVQDPADGTLVAWFPGDDATPSRLVRWSWDGVWDRGFGDAGVVVLGDADVGWRISSVHPDPARDRILVVLTDDGPVRPNVRVRSVWR